MTGRTGHNESSGPLWGMGAVWTHVGGYVKCPNCTVSSVESLSHVWFFVTPRTEARQASCPSQTPRACSHSCPSSWWCHPNISSSVMPSSPAFSLSQHQGLSNESVLCIREPSASVLPMNTQDWFPLGLIGLISLQPKGLSRVFSNTIVQKHQLSSAQLSLWSNSHIHTWLLEKS